MESAVGQSQTFCLDDYDAIGFDLDHTLVQYHLKPLSQLIFRCLTQFLIEERSYPAELCYSYAASCDFFVKGLLLDKERGNFLKLSRDHVILKATHGTQPLSSEEVEKIYGRNRVWEPTVDLPGILCRPKSNINPHFFLFRDYFVIPVPYIIARAVDLVDRCHETSWCGSYSRIWDETLEGLTLMYQRDGFHNIRGSYSLSIRQNPSLYLVKCSKEVLEWLKVVGQKKKVFLLTSSPVDYAETLLKFCVGEDWFDYFDIAVTYARKPGFFNAGRPFLNLNGATETDFAKNLSSKRVYSQGNWQELKTYFGKEPKILYVGDSLVDDVLCPADYTSCHSVAIVEEMSAEGMDGIPADHPAAEELTSKFWGSFFSDSGHPTLLDETIRSRAKIAVPHLSTLVRLPPTQRIPAFSNGNDLGYYPAVPQNTVCKGT